MRLSKRPLPELESEDRALADRMLAGDRAAFDEFFEGHFPGLYRFALARVRDPDLARDLVQSAICKAIAHLRTYRGEASLGGWLYTICRNEISGHFRKQGRVPEPVSAQEESPELEAASEDSPGAL
ncbi:MAG: RNA polymerase sigma factor, partial [Holophagales bacterium]|nr:RNA polymerase sigma factor [Holophagales bacterium]